ncbi:MAG: hypothetical protein R3E86_09915 [Pseudomonadales bacterium]
MQQVLIERIDVGLDRLVAARHGHAELVAHRLQQLARGEPRVEDERDLEVVRGLSNQVAQQGRLAGTDLAGDQHEAAVGKPVHQVGEGFAVALAQIQKFRVRGDGKRGLAQMEVIFVHQRPFPCAPSS